MGSVGFERICTECDGCILVDYEYKRGIMHLVGSNCKCISGIESTYGRVDEIDRRILERAFGRKGVDGPYSH